MLNTCCMFTLIIGCVPTWCVKLRLEFVKCLFEKYAVIPKVLTQSINFNRSKFDKFSLPRPQSCSLRSSWHHLGFLMQQGARTWILQSQGWGVVNTIQGGFLIVVALWNAALMVWEAHIRWTCLGRCVWHGFPLLGGFGSGDLSHFHGGSRFHGG